MEIAPQRSTGEEIMINYTTNWTTDMYRERIEFLEGLVREMAPFVSGSLCKRLSKNCITVWQDWNKADEMLSRPGVKEVLGGK
jgi:hypothetical protein